MMEREVWVWVWLHSETSSHVIWDFMPTETG